MLNPTQSAALLDAQETGRVGEYPFATYQQLAKLGMIAMGGKIKLTPAGKKWCDEHKGEV